jgi:holo-[acyl-carrier protein] synthase
MSIRGMGVDIVEVGRIAEMIRKYDDHFLNKICTPAEIAYCKGTALPALHFAGRWAVKEAFYKALPDECQPQSGWKSIEVLPGSTSRKPVVHLVEDSLAGALRAAGVGTVHVSISHEKTLCVACVVLE